MSRIHGQEPRCEPLFKIPFNQFFPNIMHLPVVRIARNRLDGGSQTEAHDTPGVVWHFQRCRAMTLCEVMSHILKRTINCTQFARC